MKNILWLIVGVGLGFVAAHQINKTPEGKRFFDDVDSRAHEFSNAVVDGYKEREAELRAAVSAGPDAFSDFTAR
jgi:hypothetical protein